MCLAMNKLMNRESNKPEFEEKIKDKIALSITDWDNDQIADQPKQNGEQNPLQAQS